MRVIVVGGADGGAACAACLRMLDSRAMIDEPGTPRPPVNGGRR